MADVVLFGSPEARITVDGCGVYLDGKPLVVAGCEVDARVVAMMIQYSGLHHFQIPREHREEISEWLS
jgi:hypothetical protein